MEYDIIHLEDHKITRDFVKAFVEHKLNLKNYLGVSSLTEFSSVLDVSKAKVYIIDERIPENDNGPVQYLVQRAISLIKSKIGSGAKIMIYSAYCDNEKNKDNIKCILKNGRTNELISTIETLLQ